MTNLQLILASQSPRRQELLQQIGICFDVYPVDIDETPLSNEVPADYVIRLAREKARQACIIKANDLPVLGADTAVVVENQILGKPVDLDDAKRMLQLVSGKTHQVMSAIALAQNCKYSTAVELSHALNVSEVTFVELSAEDIHDYLATGESLDKAGAYAIQGYAAAYIKELNGSYSGVMGLPLFETVQLLRDAGIR